jgi:hypothetical protein
MISISIAIKSERIRILKRQQQNFILKLKRLQWIMNSNAMHGAGRGALAHYSHAYAHGILAVAQGNINKLQLIN